MFYEIWKSGSDGDGGSYGYRIKEVKVRTEALLAIKKAIKQGYEDEYFSLLKRDDYDRYNPKVLVNDKKGKKKRHVCCH